MSKNNRQFRFAKFCVRLSQQKDTKGRFLEATEDIAAGSILISEPAFAAVVNDEFEMTCCHHCFETTAEDWIVCANCGWVRFCSSECERSANRLYHLLECKHAALLCQVDKWDRSIVLAIRILLAAKPYELLASRDSDFYVLNAIAHVQSHSSCDTDPIPDCDSSGCFQSDYCSVYSLMTHDKKQPDVAACYQKIVHQLADAFVSDIFRPRFDTCRDTELSESRTTFQQLSLSEVQDKKDVVEKLLLHHLMQLRCNVHAITKIISEEESGGGRSEVSGSVERQRQVRLAMAIFPTASLLNHSCDPNTVVSYEGRWITIRAVRQISKGDQICHCYGPHVKHMSSEKRQKLLKEQYFFECDCSACVSDCSIRNGFPDVFQCPECSESLKALGNDRAFCKGCKMSFDMASSLQDWKQAVHLYDQGTKLVDTGNHKGLTYMIGALKSFRNSLKICRRLLHVSSKTLGQTHDSIAEVYALLGNFAKAASHCAGSCKTVEALYGSDSVELGNELFKLCQLQFNARKPVEVLETIGRARHLLCLYYGSTDERVVELQQMREFLAV